jgi:hypothetical protein
LLDFGFSAGGRFDFAFYAADTYNAQAFLLNTHEISSLSSESDMCARQDHVADLNITGVVHADGLHWNGSVPTSGVYHLHFWACPRSRTQFTLRAKCLNPTSRLDTREIILPHLYGCCAAIYAIISAAWLVGAVSHMNCKIPLDTIFQVLPLIRCITLWIRRRYWSDASESDVPGRSATWELFVLEFLFYDLNLIGISMASAGFCACSPHQHSSFWQVSMDITVSASMVVGSILSARFIQNSTQALLAIGMACWSITWYLGQETSRVAVMTDVLHRFQGDADVVGKLSTSQSFAMWSWLSLIGTVVTSGILAVVGVRKTVCTVALESGHLLNTCLQIRYCIIRKGCCGQMPREANRAASTRKPVILSEPTRSGLALILLGADEHGDRNSGILHRRLLCRSNS